MGNEFVMVPRDQLVRLQENMDPHRGAVAWGIVCNLLEKPVRNQVDPVVLPGERTRRTSDDRDEAWDNGWNACLDEIAKLGPLYTHPGLDAWQKGRDGVRAERDAAMGERDTLRAQLAERDAMLRKIEGYHWANVDPEERARTRAELRDMLSASAEPSTAKQEPSDEMRIRHKREFDALDGSGFHYEECRCGTRGSYPMEVHHCVCGKPFASAEPSAPVEIDERAAFEKEFAAKGRPLTRADYDPDAYGNAFDDWAWTGWQARAALERKA